MFGKSNYENGLQLYDYEDYNGALKKLNKAIKSGELNESELANAYFVVGRCAIAICNYEKAINALKLALKWINKDYLAHFELGKAYFYNGDYGLSFIQMEEAIKCNPSKVEPGFFKAYSLYKLKQYDDAETVLYTTFKSAHPISDSETIESIDKLLVLVGLTKDYNEATEIYESEEYIDALEIYESILERIDFCSLEDYQDILDDIYWYSLRNKGICLSEIGQFSDAIKALIKVSNLSPKDPEVYHNLAMCFQSSYNFDSAIDTYKLEASCYETESEQNECYADNFTRLSIILRGNKDYQALLNYANSTSENENYTYLKAVIKIKSLYFLERYDEVLDCFLPPYTTEWEDEWFEIFFTHEMIGMAYTYMGGAYYKLKKYDTALIYLKKCAKLKYSGKFADTWLFMGECYIALGEYKNAIEALHNAIEHITYMDDYDITYLESRIQFARDKLAEKSKKLPSPKITIHGNNNPVNLGGILATDDAVINRSVIGKDNAQEETDVCFCPYCGTKINSDFLFCPKCGKKLKEN